MKNLIKNCLCIGCYVVEFPVDLDELLTTVSVEFSERCNHIKDALVTIPSTD
jgi:hypothetical protein